MTGAAGVAAAATIAGAPHFQKVKAANNQVQFAVIGTGGRGQYHLEHLNKIDSGRCVAACDIYEPNLKKAISVSRDKPQGFKDYREVLSRQDVEAVIIATPLYAHFPVTRDALLAGKHVFCEKSLVFKPDEVHALRALAHERDKQILQVGLQRRYSQFYQAAYDMVRKGLLGDVMHIHGQWHRNPGWTMKKFPERQRELNWRLFREYSGGLVAELASHQIDVADRMFGATPEFVTGVGDINYMRDGRDVYDNIQLIFRYPRGQKLVYTSICTNKHLPLFQSQRTEFGELIMGTQGTIHITVGTDNEPAAGIWFYEPPAQPAQAQAAGKQKEKEKEKEKAINATATLASTGKGARPLPILLSKDTITNNDSFLDRELKFARRWLYSKGIMLPEEDRNPVDIQLERFFESCRNGKKPVADLEIGLHDSVAVILANLSMDEGRRVYFNEIEKMGRVPEAKTRKG
jgi:predicted dehydrogenase